MSKFNNGDIVAHKSGKRPMVIFNLSNYPSLARNLTGSGQQSTSPTGFRRSTNYDCRWETDDGFDEQVFEEYELKKYHAKKTNS